MLNMMVVIEIISFVLIVCLCLTCTKSDLRMGIIRNKVLAFFCLLALILDVLYYGLFVRDMFIEFLLNFIIVTAVSLFLFYSHSFAGGDCKMLIVLSLLFPARCYLVYGDSNITLFFALAFAIFAGYCYLLIYSISAIISKKVKVTFEYIKTFLLNFVKSYIVAVTYISLIHSILLVFSNYGLNINIWITRCLCLVIALCVGRVKVFKKWAVYIPTLAAVVIISIVLKTIPISLNPGNYTLVLVLLFCQMTIRTTIYEDIKIEQLKKGMILATFSSILMQSSITKGLPGVSTEDLKSRLTETEVESIKIWAKDTHTDKLTIMKKIPFAIFISIGFLCYCIIWGVSVCV